MQTVRNGIFGPIQELNDKLLKEALADPEVDHVEVFKGAEKELNRRKKLVGKKYKVAKRFQKAPAIHPKKPRRN